MQQNQLGFNLTAKDPGFYLFHVPANTKLHVAAPLVLPVYANHGKDGTMESTLRCHPLLGRNWVLLDFLGSGILPLD